MWAMYSICLERVSKTWASEIWKQIYETVSNNSSLVNILESVLFFSFIAL